MDPGEQGIKVDLFVNRCEPPSHRWPGVLSCMVGWTASCLRVCAPAPPRLQNATLRDNVLLGGPLDKQR